MALPLLRSEVLIALKRRAALAASMALPSLRSEVLIALKRRAGGCHCLNA